MRRIFISIAIAAMFAAGFALASEPAGSPFLKPHGSTIFKTGTVSNATKKGDRLDIGRSKECEHNSAAGQQGGCAVPSTPGSVWSPWPMIALAAREIPA